MPRGYFRLRKKRRDGKIQYCSKCGDRILISDYFRRYYIRETHDKSRFFNRCRKDECTPRESEINTGITKLFYEVKEVWEDSKIVDDYDETLRNLIFATNTAIAFANTRTNNYLSVPKKLHSGHKTVTILNRVKHIRNTVSQMEEVISMFTSGEYSRKEIEEKWKSIDWKWEKMHWA